MHGWFSARFAAARQIGVGATAVLLLTTCSRSLTSLPTVEHFSIDSLSPGNQREYAIAIEPNRPLLVRVVQDEVDVRLEYQLPQASAYVSVVSPLRREGEEIAVLESPIAGTVQVRVIAQDNSKRAGTSAVIIERFPLTTRADRARVAAFREFADAARAYARQDANQFDAIAEQLGATERNFAAVGMSRERGLALLALGYLYVNHTDDWHAAIDALDSAAASFASLGEDALAAQAHALAGSALTDLAMTMEAEEKKRAFSEAQRRINDAIATHHRLGRRFDHAVAVNYLGLSCYYARDLACAASNYELARSEFSALQETFSTDMTLQNLALVKSEQGDFRTAAAIYSEILPRLGASDEQHGYADTLRNSALALAQLGETDRALEQNERSRRILAGLGEKSGEARALQGLGQVFSHLGAYGEALPLLQSAVALRRKLSNRPQLATSLRLLGEAKREHGLPEEALALHREAQELSDDAMENIRIRVEIATDLEALGKADEALALIESTARGSVPESSPVVGLLDMTTGTLLISTHKDLSRGMALLHGAVGIFAAAHARFLQVSAMSRLAAAQLEAQLPADAILTARKAIELARDVRVGVSGTALRTRATRLERDSLDVLVTALLQAETQNRPAAAAASSYAIEALLAVESARRVLYEDMLRERQLLQLGTNADSVKALTDLIAGKLARAQLLLDRRDPSPVEHATRQQEIALLQAQLDTVFTSTSIATSRLSQPLVASSLPAGKDGYAAVEYFLGKRSAWAWVASGNDLRAVRLVDREQIRDSTKKLRADIARGSEQWVRSADALSQLILAPLRLDASIPRLVVVPDDVLYDIPFSVLSLGLERRLLDTTEVTFAQALIPASPTHTHTVVASTPRILAVADPVFSTDDPRLGKMSLRPKPGAAAALPRLIGASREVTAITALAARGTVSVVSGFDATRAKVLALTRNQYDIFHFATHGSFSAFDQRLSALALSQVDATGAHVDDWLRTSDILGLPMSAQIVILSACDTAQGDVIPGQGIVGLGQAFLVAGSERVVAAQWSLPDAAATNLMTHLYAGLLERRLAAPQALRQAQLALRDRSKWRHPYYWAGLVVLSRAESGS